ncbi:hypothetical protein K7X08_001290 [Anisodus acutangulus]|uniref:Uncharacterized protein n=1 Tax=Anisodus acutangulus TaxID=402998 RepID=A0A9Q1RKG2_9SOLA|nr:hypothetical protein K7X08_001290 [Anisodus acutangulus]
MYCFFSSKILTSGSRQQHPTKLPRDTQYIDLLALVRILIRKHRKLGSETASPSSKQHSASASFSENSSD